LPTTPISSPYSLSPLVSPILANTAPSPSQISPHLANQSRKSDDVCIEEGIRVAVWFEGNARMWFLGTVKEKRGWDEDLYLVLFDDTEETEVVLSPDTHTFNLCEKDRWIFEFELTKLPSLLHVNGDIPSAIKNPKRTIHKNDFESPITKKYREAQLSPIKHPKHAGQIWCAFSAHKYHYIELEKRKEKRGKGVVWDLVWLKMVGQGEFKEVAFSRSVLADASWRFVAKSRDELKKALKQRKSLSGTKEKQ